MRHFSAYELNILLRNNVEPSSIANHDVPVEYVVGQAEFCENFFKVDNSTLIPRVETEYLIELGLKYTKAGIIKFADVGCGSGAIGLSFGIQLALRNANFSATLSDISINAIKVAQENLQTHKDQLKDNKVQIIQSDLLKAYSKDEKLNIIFANLPYIPSGRILKLDKSVREFEPLTALDGAEDGLKYIRQLLFMAPNYLSKDGIVLLEVDDSHKDPSEFKKTWNIEVKNDFNGKIRYWICHSK